MSFNKLMHERNIYKVKPNFEELAKEFPEFRQYIIYNEKGKISIDYNNSNALRALTQTLLKKDFNLDVEIPSGFLIPPVPQRLNYILWVEDLLEICGVDQSACGIDIGTGSCCILSLLGARKNNWKFIASDSSKESIFWALKNVEVNNLQERIKVMEVNEDNILKDILSSHEEAFDFCVCNPPFYGNIQEIKIKNSSRRYCNKIAKLHEVLAEGGEISFVKKIIDESLKYKKRIKIYTSMIGRKQSLKELVKKLKNKNINFTTTVFYQGNTLRWGLAWTFLKYKFKETKKPKKSKHPLSFLISNSKFPCHTIQNIFKKIQMCLKELEIITKIIKKSKKYVQLELKSNKNNWSHQRKRKRELKRKQIMIQGSEENNPLVKKTKFLETTHMKDDLSTNLNNNIDLNSKNLNLPKIENSPIFSNNFDSIRDDCSALCDEIIFKIENYTKFSSSVDINNSVKNNPLAYNEYLSHNNSKQIRLESFVTNFEIAQNECPLKDDTYKFNKESNMNSNLEVIMQDKYLNDANIFDKMPGKSILLFCYVMLRKINTNILLEMSCPDDANKQSMHEVFQLFKNKFS